MKKKKRYITISSYNKDGEEGLAVQKNAQFGRRGGGERKISAIEKKGNIDLSLEVARGEGSRYIFTEQEKVGGVDGSVQEKNIKI